MGRPCAVVGIGQTKYRKRLDDQSLEGLVREAAHQGARRRRHDVRRHRRDRDRQGARRARGRDDARAVAGRRARRGRQADPSGAHRRFGRRVDGDHRRDMVESGRYDRVLVVCYEKQSEGNATWALSGGRSGGQGAGGTFAPWIRSYIQRSGAPEHIGWKVAVKDRLERAEEPVRAPAPARHLDREGQGVADAVGPAALPRVVPVVRRRRGDRARQRGGGARRRRRSRRGSSPTPSAPSSARSRAATRCASQAGVDCAAELYRKAGITDPLAPDRLRRAVRAVLVVRADVARRPPDHRPRARGGSSPTRARPSSAARSRSTRRAACCRRTRSARRG